jgi:lauroyl/myristoyl acyltransferase
MTIQEPLDFPVLLSSSDFFTSLRVLPWQETLSLLQQLQQKYIASDNSEATRYASIALESLQLFPMMDSFDKRALAAAFSRFLLHRQVLTVMYFLYFNDEAFFKKNFEFVTYEKIADIVTSQPVIFLAIHNGFHSSIPSLLYKLGIRITAIINSDEWSTLQQAHLTYLPNVISAVRILTVPDPNILLKATRILKRGGSITIYPEFSNGLYEPKFRAKLLGRQIKAPEGPAALAKLTGYPLIPIYITHQDILRSQLIFDEPIMISSDKTYQDILDEIFARVQNIILRKPEEWFGWYLAREMVDA